MSNNSETTQTIEQMPSVTSNPSTILVSQPTNFPSSEDILTFFGFVLFANICISAYEQGLKVLAP